MASSGALLETGVGEPGPRRRQKVCNFVVILSVPGKMWLLREFGKACASNNRVKIVIMSLNECCALAESVEGLSKLRTHLISQSDPFLLLLSLVTCLDSH